MQTRSRAISAGCLALLWLLPCTAALGGAPSLSGAPSFSARYDHEIRHAVSVYWPDLPFWKLWKAQLYQESRLDPSVCSSVGACGLAQFMDPSWEDIARQIGDAGASRFDARVSIDAGAYYQGMLRRKWSADGRTILQRNDLGLCAYNRGLGNCIKDQAECGGARLWPDIAVCTARHTQETVTYVQRINQFWRTLESE